MKRIQYIDIAKGIGIMLVVIGHSHIEYGHYLIYMFHMPLFFYLSGIFYKQTSVCSSIKGKAKKLLVPFAIFLVVLMLFNIFDKNWGGRIVLKPPHLRGSVGPLWFLIALFIVSVGYNFLSTISKNKILLITIAISFFLGYLPDRIGWANYFYLFSSCSVGVFYCLGDLYGRRKTIDKKISSATLTILCGILFCLIYLIGYKMMHLRISDLFNNCHSENYIIWILGSLSGIGMIVGLSKTIEGNNFVANTFAYLGERSLYIFAFHLPVITVMHNIISKSTLFTETMIIVIAICMGCLCGTLFKKLLPGFFQ